MNEESYHPLKPIIGDGHLVPKSCRRSILNMLRELYLVHCVHTINSFGDKIDKIDIRQILCTISNPPTWKILEYLFDNGAVTSVIVRRRLHIPRRTAFQSLDDLRALGLIELSCKAWVPRMKGRPSNVYQLLDADIEAVQKTVNLHNLLFSSKKYRVADKLAQTILEEFMEKEKMEIKYNEIIARVKTLRIPFSTPDISDMVARILNEKGIRIWR